MSKEILFTDELRLRVLDLEYKGLDENKFIEEVQRIYFEETGQVLPTEIKYFNSIDSQSLKNDTSGYDGTALHFYSEEDQVNQLYIVSQGSQGSNDWNYNIQSLFAGDDARQATSTNDFIHDVINQLNDEETNEQTSIPTIIGLSHSLAHNNNTTARLVDEQFDKIYSVNGAQTNYYQLFNTDVDFKNEIRREFGIGLNDTKAIYSIPPLQLKEFAISYYEEQGLTDNIHQLISKDDPLYAVSGVRGFFPVGELTLVDSNPDVAGLRELMDQIPDDTIAQFQQFAIQYTEASKQGGVPQAIQDLTGFDMSILDGIDGGWSAATTYVTKGDEISDMLADMNGKVPDLLDSIQVVTSNGDAIFGGLAELGYLSNSDKEKLIREFSNIEAQLEEVEEIIGGLHKNREFFYGDTGFQMGGGDAFSAVLGGDVGAYLKLKSIYQSLAGSFTEISEILDDVLSEIGHSHSIAEMLNALGAARNRAYHGSDMIMMTTSGSQQIKVNISAAIRMYQNGQSLLEEKRGAVQDLVNTHHQEIYESFTIEKNKVVNRINDIEGNPRAYSFYLSNPSNKRVRRIQVHDSLQPLTGVEIDSIHSQLQQSITDSQTFLQSSREAIEALFEKDQDISALFDYQPGG